jgi:2'-5' RNA ligase
VSADPLIVSALLGPRDFAWLDGLRRAHYPPDRNRVPAHLTLFRHLPPSLGPELKQRLTEATRAPRPRAEAAGLINLGRGVAVRIEAPALEAIRTDLAQAFSGLLMPQDTAPWRPHVTIQNKVTPEEARGLLKKLAAEFRRRPVAVEGLAVWAYRDGDWDPLSRYSFRG